MKYLPRITAGIQGIDLRGWCGPCVHYRRNHDCDVIGANVSLAVEQCHISGWRQTRTRKLTGKRYFTYHDVGVVSVRRHT